MPAVADALTLTLPVGLPAAEARLLLAVKLFEVSRVSLGIAAEVAGLPKRAFIDVLGQHRVPVLNQSPESLREELADLESEFPLRADHVKLLEERRAAHHQNPEATIPWEEVKNRLVPRR